ncbi:MAG: GDP-mannose 4,6-dehydratase [Planctomycetes bacterium]|nr:GDP-mannose 4,6-dehydratase [Planctomycetota bacterium]MCW8136214.1 GDP-mannose 4,6-dehydratase [Planctomycetota bacterium]
MRVFLTGAAGFIGSHVARALLARGDSVVGFDDFNDFYDPAIKRRNASEITALGARMIEGDLRKKLDVEKALGQGCDVVVNLAARAGVRPSLENPELYADTNVKGTIHVLEAMRARGLRKLVHASSSSVYGGQEKVPFSESDPINRPWSPYAATKRANELYLQTYHHLYGIESHALRFFTVYGPSQRPDLAIMKFIQLIEAGREVPFYGDGKSGRDYTYIDDIVQGVVSSIDRVSGCEIINLGGDEPVTLTQMVQTIEQATGKKATLKHLPDQPGDVPRTMADISKARRLLGYEPKTNFAQGVAKQVEWWRSFNAG